MDLNVPHHLTEPLGCLIGIVPKVNLYNHIYCAQLVKQNLHFITITL